jgi:hypothetical protein
MKFTKIIIDAEKIQEILVNYGVVFERPVDTEKFAIEIFSSCKVIHITDVSEFAENTSFEVSHSDGN